MSHRNSTKNVLYSFLFHELEIIGFSISVFEIIIAFEESGEGENM